MSAPLAGILLAFVFTQTPSDCADVAACRSAALEAASRQDYEAFHDLAWRAVQKGRPNDPDLLYLVARAQALSGRPGDSLVILRRLAQMGVPTDASKNDDFERVRALPGWPEVEALMMPLAGAPAGPAPAVPTSTSPSAPVVPPAAASSTPRPKEVPRKEAPKPDAPRIPAGAESEPLLSAALDPVGLAYDSVSRRFIVGDRETDKLVVIDPVFKRASDMVGSSAGFFGVTAFAIDRERGDLWVANSRAGRAALQKLQLVSGRVLFTATPADEGGAHFPDVAVTPAGQVLVLDSTGRRILRVKPGRRALETAADIVASGATSLALLDEQHVLVAHEGGLLRVDLLGGSLTPLAGVPAGLTHIRVNRGSVVGVQQAGGRTAVVRMVMKGTKAVETETLVADAELPSPTSFTIEGNMLHFVTRDNGQMVLRRVRLR